MLSFSLLVWMLFPLWGLLLYAAIERKEALKPVAAINLIALAIVGFYPPMMELDTLLPSVGYFIVKAFLFIALPLAALIALEKKGLKGSLHTVGVKKEGIRKSVLWGLALLPVMLAANFLVSAYMGWGAQAADPWYSAMMFFESFTEEFFFRGVLFLYLWKKADLWCAYVTSNLCFLLVHPQYFFGVGMLQVIVQGVLTAVVAHKSENIAGPWLLHGINRVFSLSLLPLML